MLLQDAGMNSLFDTAESDKGANRLFDADLLLVATLYSSITRSFFVLLVHLETVKPTESRFRLQSSPNFKEDDEARDGLSVLLC